MPGKKRPNLAHPSITAARWHNPAKCSIMYLAVRSPPGRPGPTEGKSTVSHGTGEELGKFTVYQTHREGKLLPEDQWVKVRGVIDFHTGGTKRSQHQVANVYDKDFKPLLGDLEHAVVEDAGNGRFAIQGKQKATHEKGMYWDKQWYLQVWGCVPV